MGCTGLGDAAVCTCHSNTLGEQAERITWQRFNPSPICQSVCQSMMHISLTVNAVGARGLDCRDHAVDKGGAPRGGGGGPDSRAEAAAADRQQQLRGGPARLEAPQQALGREGGREEGRREGICTGR